MKKVSYVVDSYFHKNILFDKDQTSIVARDDCLKPYHILFEEFYKNGYLIATNDIHTIEDSDIVIYSDMPKKLPLKKDINKSYLLMLESPLVCPQNFDIEKHKYFNKIFTWDDRLIDNKKYFKYNYSFVIPKSIPKKLDKQKLLCLIVGNKYSNYPDELYSKRRELIRWFEANHSEDFDLYGVGWNEFRFSGILPIRALNRVSLARGIAYKLFGENYPSYKGKIANKFETMQNYKFAICYENIQNISGYITEKMLDAMFAGCIPIYLGADNVAVHIPQNSFIDKKNFSTYEELYKYISNISDDEYMKYLENIECFLNSEKGFSFSAEVNADRLVQVINKG